MSLGRSQSVRALLLAGVLGTLCPDSATAADVYVAAGGDLQVAINTAVGGDTIYLQAGPRLSATSGSLCTPAPE